MTFGLAKHGPLGKEGKTRRCIAKKGPTISPFHDLTSHFAQAMIHQGPSIYAHSAKPTKSPPPHLFPGAGPPTSSSSSRGSITFPKSGYPPSSSFFQDFYGL
ncbi:Uncharacterized protein TCM_034936 [Theobroma cacao]|uniref:Uncharacterized protein n=1 Tax=Theobroma cacao TaxID=3641 RepID=A0A061FFC2_THECC|nr:Uncharacterized protein TCM_034936 [Theobroma cacao]